MKKHIKALWLTLLIAAFGVAIGFLGELMPDGFKSKVEAFATQTFGISYTKVWLIAAGLLVLLFLFFVWREAVQKEKPGNDPPSHQPKVLQTGDKPIYIEDNKGPININ
jgi:hypothetical protein